MADQRSPPTTPTHLLVSVRFDGLPKRLEGQSSIRLDYWRTASEEDRADTLRRLGEVLDDVARVATRTEADHV